MHFSTLLIALQREEMWPLEAIYMNLAEVTRMVPFLHQLVSYMAIPHPCEGEEKNRKEKVVKQL